MNRIKEALIEAGVRQNEMAKRLGKGVKMVNLYATKKGQTPIPVIYRIEEILNGDVRKLLGPNGKKK